MNKEIKDRIGARLGQDMSPSRIEAIKICEMMERVGQNYYVEYTDFLEAEVRILIEELAAYFYKDVAIEGHCGFPEKEDLVGERFMLALMSRDFHDSLKGEALDYPLKVLKLSSTDQRFEPRHRDVLGSLMGLGIRREMVGDIKVRAKEGGKGHSEKGSACVYLAIESSMHDFIASHLVKIGPWQITISEADQEELMAFEDDGESCTFTVKSMRLDALLAEGFNLSREVASRLVESGKVKVNHRLEESKSKEIKEGDLISARGYGRLRIKSTGDRTRKDRLWIEAIRYR